MSYLKEVKCPNKSCGSKISWKILYSNRKSEAKRSVNKIHSCRCGQCGTVFVFTPRQKESGILNTFKPEIYPAYGGMTLPNGQVANVL